MANLSGLVDFQAYGLGSIMKITILVKSMELRYYISSRAANAESLGKGIRSHWGIENKVHHVLDVREDRFTCVIDSSPHKLQIIRIKFFR